MTNYETGGRREHDWTDFKKGKPTGWTLDYVAKTLSENLPEEELGQFTIIFWNTEHRGKEIPKRTVLCADIMVLDGVVVKDRTGFLKGNK